MKNKPLIEYRRNLPHIQPKDAAFFITFRLYGSIPLSQLESMSQQYLRDKNIVADKQHVKMTKHNSQEAYFEALDDYLDTSPNGPYYLANAHIATLVKEAIHYRDAKDYSLICYCLMSNHVHLIIYKLKKPLHIVMKELKGFTGKEALKILDSVTPTPSNSATSDTPSKDKENVSLLINSQQALRDSRPKKFWQAESFDRIIRDGNDLQRKIEYTLNNPVKAGLVGLWKNWPHSYIAPGYME
jgi:REP element-mobilizing transposase RayT